MPGYNKKLLFKFFSSHFKINFDRYKSFDEFDRPTTLQRDAVAFIENYVSLHGLKNHHMVDLPAPESPESPVSPVPSKIFCVNNQYIL